MLFSRMGRAACRPSTFANATHMQSAHACAAGARVLQTQPLVQQRQTRALARCSISGGAVRVSACVTARSRSVPSGRWHRRCGLALRTVQQNQHHPRHPQQHHHHRQLHTSASNAASTGTALTSDGEPQHHGDGSHRKCASELNEGDWVQHHRSFSAEVGALWAMTPGSWLMGVVQCAARSFWLDL